jgi:hypothetical protein
MVSGYTPMVPTLGSLTMSAAALLLLIVYLAWLAASVRRKRHSATADS